MTITFCISFWTKSCLLLLTDKNNNGFESGNYTGLILIDLFFLIFDFLSKFLIDLSLTRNRP